MDKSISELGKCYQSKRLRFIPIDESDDRVRTYITEMMNDPAVHALASSILLRPQGKNDVDFMIKMLGQALLGVAICLLPSEPSKRSADADIQNGLCGDKPTPTTVIGSVCLGWGGIPSTKTHNRAAAIGITILEGHQNKGYGREAINWALDWAFKHAGLHTVEVSTVSYNERAVHLYKKLGFVPTGYRRETCWHNRRFYDELIFSMTEAEWEILRTSDLPQHMQQA